jgi:hypothetical protein
LPDLSKLDLSKLELPTPDMPDDPSEPPPLSETEVANVGALARMLAKRIGRQGPPDLNSPDMAWLAHNPRALWPVLDGMVAAGRAPDRDPGLLQAYNYLLVHQLEQIRYRQELGWEWADRMLVEYQERIIQIARDKTIPEEDWHELAAALTRAKVPVSPDIMEALAESGLAVDLSEGAASFETLRATIDELAQACERPFDLIAAFSELGGVLPADLRTFMAHEMALSNHRIMRDTVPLMLLDPDAGVRRATASVLEQTAEPETMSGEALRRIIAVRNWIPEPDRAAIDRAIRKARTKGVECAQWPPAPNLDLLATSIDGSGAQSVLTTSWSNRKGTVAGVLLKQGFGIRDSWCETDMSRKEITATQRTLVQETGATEIDRGYMDAAVQHAIAVGVAAGNVPNPVLLDVAEHVCAVDWQDRRLDIPAEARRLFEALEPAQRTPKAITDSLRRSGRWMKTDAVAESWFEDGPDVRALIDSVAQEPDDVAARLVMTEILPKTRNIWAERLLLLALEAQASRAPVRRGQRLDLAILAQELCGGRPLEEIPLMFSVAEQTVVAARSGAW